MLCMANETVSLHQVKLQTYNLASRNLKAFVVHQAVSSADKWVSWHPTNEQAVILNVDGNSMGNPGPAGFGGVLRHSSGDWISGFAGSVGWSTVLHVELLSIFYGLKVAWDQGHKDLICYNDSTLAIHLINEDLNHWHHYASIIANIKNLVERNWRIRFDHTMREANSAADLMAKRGAAGPEVWSEFIVPPADVLPILQSDAARIKIARR